MGVRGAFAAKTQQQWEILTSPNASRGGQGERSQDVPPEGTTKKTPPPLEYEGVIDPQWMEDTYAGGEYTTPPDAYVPTVDMLTTDRNAVQGRSIDTNTETAQVKEHTELSHVGEQVNAYTYESVPLGEFVPDAARRRGFSALPGVNDFARSAREFIYRFHRDRLNGTERVPNVRPFFKNGVEASQNVRPTGNDIYMAWQTMARSALRNPENTQRNMPSSPAENTGSAPGYQETIIEFMG